MQVINNNNLPTASITELTALQGNLKFLSKDNYKKLKKSIEKHGFYIPVYVWIDENGKKWLLDGTQRSRVLTAEKWLEPIPYLTIKAPDIATATQRLLTITSQYGTITQEGLDEFIATFELPEAETLDMTHFDAIFNFSIDQPEEQSAPEVEKEDFGDVFSAVGKMYALGEHRIVCGDPKEAEVAPEKMDAYRKKYQKIITGSETGWQEATPEVEFNN